MESWVRSLGRAVGLSLLGALFVGALFTDWSQPWVAAFARNSAVGATYALLISVPSTIVLRLFGDRFAQRRALVRWVIYIALMFGLAMAGSLAAGVVFMAVGYVEPAQYWVVFRGGATIASVITFCFGAGAFVYDNLLR